MLLGLHFGPLFGTLHTAKREEVRVSGRGRDVMVGCCHTCSTRDTHAASCTHYCILHPAACAQRKAKEKFCLDGHLHFFVVCFARFMSESFSFLCMLIGRALQPAETRWQVVGWLGSAHHGGTEHDTIVDRI